MIKTLLILAVFALTALTSFGKQLVVWFSTIIIFGTVTISTAKLETAFDGNDAYGFPFYIFEYWKNPGKAQQV